MMAFLLLFMFGPAMADWQRTAGLPGGTVYTLIANEGNLFAEAYGEGPAVVDGGIFRSTDDGATWITADSGLPKSETVYNPVFCGDRLFAGTQEKGFRSSDLGASWSAIDIGVTLPDPVHFLPVGGNRLFAIKRDPSVILRSDDCGDSWYFQNPFWPVKGGIDAVAMSGGFLIAGALPNYGPSGDVYRSSDNGATWLVANTGLPPYPQVLAFAVSDTQVLAVINGKGLFRSSDHGLTWSAVNTEPILPLITCLAVVGHRLFAGTAAGVFHSSDEGLHWEPAASGLPGSIRIENFAATGTHLFLGTLDGKVWKRPLAEFPSSIRQAANYGKAWGFEGNQGAILRQGSTIPFSIGSGGLVEMGIFDMKGIKVGTLLKSNLGAGRHQTVFAAGGLAGGIYHMRLQASGSAWTRRFILEN